MVALEWVTVQGFRSIASIEKLRLHNINVIIGSNGSGKSNFIGVFSFLNHVTEARLQEYVGRAGGASSILHFGSRVTKLIDIKLSFWDDVNQYEIRLMPTNDDRLLCQAEIVSYWDKSRFSSPLSRSIYNNGLEAGITLPNDGINRYVKGHLERWRIYHFHDTSNSSPMKQMSDVGDNRFLRADGSNIAAFLYMLKHVHPNSYGLIVGAIKTAAPFFEDFNLNPSILNPEKIILEWKHAGSDAYFSASSLSDGTLRFIALTTLLLQPSIFRPSVILIDEPELGLHPYALTVLASMVRQAATSTQLIISTQSALLLDCFEPEEVLVADRVNNGTQFNRLSSNDLSEWLEDYSLGQLWEKAEFGGRPSSSTGKVS